MRVGRLERVKPTFLLIDTSKYRLFDPPRSLMSLSTWEERGHLAFSRKEG
jgi:hypothetical protein